jgi:ABC-type glycerol-3-phosphate transport system substrate-binding protein
LISIGANDYQQAAPFIMSSGGYWFDKQGNPDFHNEGNYRGYEFLKTLVDKEYMLKGSAGIQGSLNRPGFVRGDFTIYVGHSGDVRTLKDYIE